MPLSRFATAVVVTAACCLSFPAMAQEGGARESVGTVQFENSGSDAAQPAFSRGLALLHNFEYSRAAAAFREAQELDPDFAMAFWGEAMTYNHAVWMEQDRDAALAVLSGLGPTPGARAARAGTERERDYLEAIEILYAEGPKEERDLLYEEAMARLSSRYPGDVDAAAFHALSILGTAHAGRDFATYMRSAAILEEIFPENRDHPGVLHYLIHSYDDPIHAPLGLRAARRYGRVAPDAAHALHMTSHIFVALGMWDDVISANEQAISVVNARRRAAGRPDAYCGHYPSWLVYGYLQRGEMDSARRYIDGCRDLALESLQVRSAENPDPDYSVAGSYLWVRTMLAAETGTWSPQDDIPMDLASNWEQFREAYGRLLGANALEDLPALVEASASLDRLAPELLEGLDRRSDPSVSARAAIRTKQLQGRALVALRRGEESGMALLTQAASVETSAPIEFGPPIVEKPSFELLADELMKRERVAEAASAYEAALSRTPGRTRSVEGLEAARAAAEAAGVK